MLKHWKCLAIAAVLASSTSTARSQDGFDAQARVTEALNAVRPIAMNRDRVDWNAVEARARDLAASAQDTIDLLPAYHLIVWSLNDNHSRILPSDEQVDEWIRRNGRERFLPDLPRRRAIVSEFRGRQVSGRDLSLANESMARLVVIPAFNEDDADNAFAQSITTALDRPGGSCGYVVDLRGNTGGNMFPMIAGLWPLLGDDFTLPVAAPGVETGRLFFRDGQMVASLSDDSNAEVLGRLPTWSGSTDEAARPVAVLVDHGVASSGEGTALALRGRPQTRFFGETTFGAASGNAILTLSDGLMMAVTFTYLKDRDGRIYPDGIPPDEVVETGPGLSTDPDDAVVEAAKTWLSSQPGCTGSPSLGHTAGY